jgi:hypothetical protein
VYERTGALLVANRATHAFLLEQLKGVPIKNPEEGREATGASPVMPAPGARTSER